MQKKQLDSKSKNRTILRQLRDPFVNLNQIPQILEKLAALLDGAVHENVVALVEHVVDET